MKPTALSTGLLVLLISAGGASVTVQTPNFSGIWALQPAESEIDTAAVLHQIGAGGTPPTLHIAHAANGDVTVLSQQNESIARVYRPYAPSSIPDGPDTDVAVTTRWEANTLVVEGSRGGMTLGRRLSLSPDGQTLVVQVTDGSAVSTLVYARTTTVPPCESWPTPCLED